MHSPQTSALCANIPLQTIARLKGTTEDLQSTTILPVIVFPPPPQIPSSIVASRPSQLRPDPHEFLPSSSHTHTVFSARNVDPDDLQTMMLQDLSKHIMKDGDYPVACGEFGEIWKCSLYIDRSSVKVCLPSFVCPSVSY